MPSTLSVLIILLTHRLLIPLVHLVIACVLAKRKGLKMTKVSWSSAHGLTAEFERRN